MRNPLRSKRNVVVMAGALCLAATGIGTASATAAPTPPPAAAPVPVLDWAACDQGFLCATATAPLDYADPAGETVHLAVIKHPATDPAHRIGSVFFNPGGPGASGVETLPQIYAQFPADVRARFDVVSFDPRGIGRSTDIQCFDTEAEEAKLTSVLPDGVPGYPLGPEQQQVWENTLSTLDNACATHAGPLLAHDTTADVARDMDLLRQAVGDPTVNYIGMGYGSYLGATYANLFPDRVRAMTLDGNVDPVAWATGTGDSANRLSTWLREGNDEGSAVALNAFFDLCGRAATGACAFSAGSPAATRAKYDALLDRLDGQPVTTAGFTFTRAFTVSLTVRGLNWAEPIPNVTNGWSGLATILQSVWALTNGDPAPPIDELFAQDILFPSFAFDAPYIGREGQLGPVCSDSPNPRDPASYPAQAAFATARSGVVGPRWAWADEGCARWPVLSADRYAGPWNHPTAPILVVNTTIDPANPYWDAVAMARDLANARLLTVNGYGNSTLANRSTCANTIEDAYFVTGALPRPGTVCQQDQAPFAG